MGGRENGCLPLRKGVRTLYCYVTACWRQKAFNNPVSYLASLKQDLRNTKYSVNAGSTSKSKVVDEHSKYDPHYIIWNIQTYS